jgi:hypothetical protein
MENEQKNLQQNSGENSVAYKSFSELFRAAEASNPNITRQQFMNAVSRTQMYNYFTANPYIQNDRVKNISSKPNLISKDKIVECLLSPDHSEKPLRELSDALVWTAYPYFKLIKTTADILTYRHYIYPKYIDESDAKTTEFKREWQLAERINEAIKPAQTAHEATMISLREGKAFYLLRRDIDRSHLKVNYCFLQQLPQDWVKIVGYNNISKYSVAFNMMYFTKEGTDIYQYGDLFVPYMDDFYSVVDPTYVPSKNGKVKVVFSEIAKNAKKLSKNAIGSPEIYSENGRWFYWVTLPATAVWTFEIDDSSRNVISPFAGLMLSMSQIAQYENLQLELLANPLVSILTGEIETYDNSQQQMEDAYKLSPSGRQFFEALWYQMLYQNNTSGIGFYAAPLKNMKLQQLEEAPNATNISSEGYAYIMMKSGNGLLPLSTEPRAGMVDYSAKIESQYGRCIYRTFENLMNFIYADTGLKRDWRFKMFGNIFSERQELEDARKGMALGILMDTLRYDAILGHSLLDDMAISDAITASGILNKRIPLITSYTMKQGDNGGLPPQAQIDTGGRPSAEMGEIQSVGEEESFDAGE